MVTQRRVYQCLSALTFFGLTQPYRLSVFSQIHEIVFHGKGGYTWGDVYNMPLWLRKFTFEKIKEFYEKEKEEMEKRNKQTSNESPSKLSRPNITPDYSYKAPRK